MWLGEKITEYGLGNGTSLIIFSGILARIPAMIAQLTILVKGRNSVNIIQVVLFIVFALALVAGVVTMDLSRKKNTSSICTKKSWNAYCTVHKARIFQ
ncbi:MAG: hypothetical protein KatS3mg079_412 [Caloramator sp.]|nr:MAG: hypothetical protein KatS3mg079_412 [Caloramator sp.]